MLFKKNIECQFQRIWFPAKKVHTGYNLLKIRGVIFGAKTQALDSAPFVKILEYIEVYVL